MGAIIFLFWAPNETVLHINYNVVNGAKFRRLKYYDIFVRLLLGFNIKRRRFITKEKLVNSCKVINKTIKRWAAEVVALVENLHQYNNNNLLQT